MKIRKKAHVYFSMYRVQETCGDNNRKHTVQQNAIYKLGCGVAILSTFFTN
jgi:hypothetical protein